MPQRITKEEARRRMDEILKEQMERPGLLRPGERNEEANNPFRAAWSGTAPSVQPQKNEAVSFAKPDIPDETLVDHVIRAAYSIISLAFKEDNKWRLHDGTNTIIVSIADDEFLQKVDSNQIAFSKGGILICDVRVTQKRTDQGLRTEYTVERAVDYKPAARQLPLI